MEPLFVAEIVGSPGKMTLFIQNCCKCEYKHYSTVAFDNARIAL